MKKSLEALFTKKNSYWLLIILVLLSLNFILQLGLVSDDSYNVHIRGYLLEHQESILHYLKAKLLEIQSASRFQQFGFFYNYVTYYLTQNVLIIKIITLCLIASNIYLFYSVIKSISKSRDLALLSATFIPFLFQVRPWHDPIIAFTFMFPFMFFLIFLSLSIFLNFLKKPNYIKLFFSFFFYLLACFIYEIPYFISPIFTLAAYNYQKNFFKAVKSSLPYWLLALVLVCIIYYRKEFTTAVNWRTDINIQGQFWLAFSKQLLSSLPFSFMTLSHTYEFKYSWSDLPLLFAFPFLLYKIFSSINLKKLPKSVYLNLTFIGLFLLIIPAAITAMSGHQQGLVDIDYGFGYLPVYFQYFGIAIIFGILVNKYATHIFSNKKRILVLVIISTSLLILNYGSNKDHSLSSNVVFKYPRALLEASVEAGLMDKVSENDLIFNRFYVPSDHFSGYMTRLNKRLNVCDVTHKSILEKKHSDFKKCFGDGFGNGHNFKSSNVGNLTYLTPIKNTWFTHYEFDRRGKTGFVFLAKIDEIIIDSDTASFISITSKNLDIFELTEEGHDVKSISDKNINMYALMNNRNNSYSTKKPSQYRKPLNLSDFYFADHTNVWSGGAYPPEGTLRWTNGNAKLKIFNLRKNETKNLLYSFTIFSPTGRKSTISVNGEPMVLMPNKEIFIKNVIKVNEKPFELNITSDDTYLDNGDPRKIVFGISNYIQQDIGGIKEIAYKKYSNGLLDTADGEISINFSSGWSDPQDGHRWTNAKESTITFINRTSKEISTEIMFIMSILQSQSIEVSINNVNLESYSNTKPGDNNLFKKEIKFVPGKNILKITTDSDPISPGNGDIRKLGISISNLNIKFNL